MFDLHTHSLLSDGELLPSELARRFEDKGYKAIAITDHVDVSNIKMVVPAIVEFCKKWPKNRIKVLAGIELTHIPFEHFAPLINYARKKGIKIIVAHGQTISEPVISGTNALALHNDIDILAHPGYITKEEVLLAKQKNIFLEITFRSSHSLTNQHVLKLARDCGAKLILNSDSHECEDILSLDQRSSNCLKLGLAIDEIRKIEQDTAEFISTFKD